MGKAKGTLSISLIIFINDIVVPLNKLVNPATKLLLSLRLVIVIRVKYIVFEEPLDPSFEI